MESLIAEAEVRLRRTEEGGRSRPLAIVPHKYRPHLIVHGTEEMLGVMFMSGPEILHPGEAGTVAMLLMYHPQVSYEALAPGVRFRLMEGPRAVGDGTITRRWAEGGRKRAEDGRT